jgi:hypothetical protein
MIAVQRRPSMMVPSVLWIAVFAARHAMFA